MRLFHTLKDADSALKLFKDESLDGFFDQLISYQLLLDLLYELGRFQEILDTYKIIQERQVK
jgi:pentatricopeptide repeat domain-containing protein 2